MHQVVLKRGTAPDYGTFVYPLKVRHTHPHMSKTVGSHQTWILQLIVFSAVRSKRGSAPDYGTFIYALKVPHTHPHR